MADKERIAQIEMQIQALQSRVDHLMNRDKAHDNKLSELSKKIAELLEELNELSNNASDPMGF